MKEEVLDFPSVISQNNIETVSKLTPENEIYEKRDGVYYGLSRTWCYHFNTILTNLN